jgi:A/G-specific adenine glycosylase
MNEKEIRSFQRTVYKNASPLRLLPWRWNDNPYHVVVSELMLQQTQVDRVLPRFEEFTICFPSFRALANASFEEVFSRWQGLGYNRRAQHLHTLAKIVSTDYLGELPRCKELLRTLPGIGTYTAAAISVIAFQEPAAMIETNIRTAYHHSFFSGEEGIRDAQLLPIIEQTIDKDDCRSWFYALMDYGSKLKSVHRGIGQMSAHYKKQSKFVGSNRQARGQILSLLSKVGPCRLLQLVAEVGREKDEVMRIVISLEKEAFVVRDRWGRYTINPA